MIAIYVFDLPQNIQDEIRAKLEIALTDIFGSLNASALEAVENGMNEKISSLSDTINIRPYLNYRI